MKSLLALFLVILSVVAFSGTPNIHRPHRRISTLRKTQIVVPWKTVAAGGAAAGTVIAAYKVSDGVEEGIKTVAKEKPEAFADSLSVLTWPVRMAAFIFFLISGCWIWKKWLEHETIIPKGNETWKPHSTKPN